MNWLCNGACTCVLERETYRAGVKDNQAAPCIRPTARDEDLECQCLCGDGWFSEKFQIDHLLYVELCKVNLCVSQTSGRGEP